MVIRVSMDKDEYRKWGVHMSSELHKHKCAGCGHVWQHDQNAAMIPGSHTCSKCGSVQRFKYYGDEPPRLPYLKPPTEDHFP